MADTTGFEDTTTNLNLMDPGSLSGNMEISEEDEGTLDEPILDTLKRDAKAVLSKFLHVLLPRRNKLLLQDWDLWGPLLLTVTLALYLLFKSPANIRMLRSSAQSDQKTEVFSGVFFIIWAGSLVITVNAKLLGGTLVCVLGYCLLPIVLSCLFLRLVSAFVSALWFRFIVVCIGLGWSVAASVGFVWNSSPSSRKALIVYPIVLFYVVIAWLVLNDR